MSGPRYLPLSKHQPSRWARAVTPQRVLLLTLLVWVALVCLTLWSLRRSHPAPGPCTPARVTQPQLHQLHALVHDDLDSYNAGWAAGFQAGLATCAARSSELDGPAETPAETPDWLTETLEGAAQALRRRELVLNPRNTRVNRG